MGRGLIGERGSKIFYFLNTCRAAEARAARELSDYLASCANGVNLDDFIYLER